MFANIKLIHYVRLMTSEFNLLVKPVHSIVTAEQKKAPTVQVQYPQISQSQSQI